MSLLRKQTPGSSIPLELVGPPNNQYQRSGSSQYQRSGSSASVGSDGMSATARISHFSIFALTSEKPAVRVTPSPVTIQAGQTIQFTASVSGNGIQDVFYTAPSAFSPFGWVDLKAFSVDDPTASFEVQSRSRLQISLMDPTCPQPPMHCPDQCGGSRVFRLSRVQIKLSSNKCTRRHEVPRRHCVCPVEFSAAGIPV